MDRELTERELDEKERDLERVVKTHQKHLDDFRESRKGKRVNANGNHSRKEGGSPEQLQR